MIMAALGSRDPPRPPDPPSAGAGSRAGVTSIIINITLLTSINTPGNKSGHQTQVRQYRTYEYLHILCICYYLVVVAAGCRQAAVITLDFLLDICPARLLCSLCTVYSVQMLLRRIQTIYIPTIYLAIYKHTDTLSIISTNIQTALHWVHDKTPHVGRRHTRSPRA